MTAKMTVLEMVQDIMSDLDSDEVTSITDTVESEQVERVLKQVYFQLCANQMIPEHAQLDRLETVSLVSFPGSRTFLHIPDTVQDIQWFKYDIETTGDVDESYADIYYRTPKEFIDLVSTNRSSDSACVQITDPTSGVTFYVRSDTTPRHWTTFDDQYITTDSYDASVDATQVLGTKSKIFATVVPAWDTSDDFTPAIDDNLFPYLVAEAKSTCFVNLKQTSNPKIEKQARDQKIAIQQRKFRTDPSEKGAINSTSGINYGRRSPR